MNDDLVKQLLAAVLDLSKTVSDLKQTVGGLTASVEALNKRFDDQNWNFKLQSANIQQNFNRQSSDIRQIRNWIVRGLFTLIAIVLSAALAQYCGVSDKIETIRQFLPPQ